MTTQNINWVCLNNRQSALVIKHEGVTILPCASLTGIKKWSYVTSISNSILFFCLILRLHQELYFFHSVKFDVFKKVCNTLEGQTQVDPSTSLLIILPQFQLNPPDRICNSPYCQPNSFYNVNSEDLVLDQLIIPKLIYFFFSTLIWLIL